MNDLPTKIHRTVSYWRNKSRRNNMRIISTWDWVFFEAIVKKYLYSIEYINEGNQNPFFLFCRAGGGGEHTPEGVRTHSLNIKRYTEKVKSKEIFENVPNNLWLQGNTWMIQRWNPEIPSQRDLSTPDCLRTQLLSNQPHPIHSPEINKEIVTLPL